MTTSTAASLARIPCTIVTGFLGAGKTTLIRHVLANAGGRRLAVIVNEFGDVGIDGEILKGCGDSACPEENIVELANGCLCCTVADEFVPALDAILAMVPRVEHIVIETSGLALPKPLVQAFHWPSIKSRVTVDGVVTVVDGAALADGRVAFDLDALAAQRKADNALDHDDPIEEVFEDQIACADLVVLNKCDLLDQSGIDRASSAVAGVLPRTVKVVRISGGKVDVAALLGLNVGTETDIENRKIVSATAEAAGVLRIKGFAAVRDKPMRLLVQAVGPRVTTHYDRHWAVAEKRETRLVVIGLKGLDQTKIVRMLNG
jgi:cobalamin biosynthesis protein CobW